MNINGYFTTWAAYFCWLILCDWHFAVTFHQRPSLITVNVHFTFFQFIVMILSSSVFNNLFVDSARANFFSGWRLRSVLSPKRSRIQFLDGNKLLRLVSLCSRWEIKPSNLLKLSRNDWSTNCLHHTQFRSSLIPQYVMRFTLTIIVIITIIKNKHLLSDEIFMETFQDGEFSMKCRKYQ